MNKSITLVTGSNETQVDLMSQLNEYIPEYIKIKSVVTDYESLDIISDDLVILSSSIVKDELEDLHKLDLASTIIIANRTVSYDRIDKVVLLPPHTDVLLVNDAKESAYETIDTLMSLGLDYINYIPYYPGIIGDFAHIKLAITPGEIERIPPFVSEVINIGSRVMDFSTIAEVLSHLGILTETAGNFSQKYLTKIINMSKNLSKAANEIRILNDDLNIILDRWDEGILVIDKKGQIIVLNENLRKLLKIKKITLLKKRVHEVITIPSLTTFLLSDVNSDEQIITINNEDILVNKHFLSSNQTTVVGFKNIKATLDESDRIKRELIKKGHYAKYAFDDFIGHSTAIQSLKSISKKIAKSELTVLIEGESGTGKEMIASAIHNSSPRKNGPFLAVNFSAFPDDLIESEIFGYEEGSFTGAKKGGKIGLFEQANGGTIFLDEIGDISLKMQAKLLRVLQEKEIMRIGGTHIKPIDVRIIAATNKNLEQMVLEHKFREDLYYRLKLGYINTIPLRNRKEDIKDLVLHIIDAEEDINIAVSDDVYNVLTQYNWLGNVRELKNTILYMLAVRSDNHLTVNDLPSNSFFKKSELTEICTPLPSDKPLHLSAELMFILSQISKLNADNILVGGDNLSAVTKGTTFEMTKYQMRNRLEHLERLGCIDRKKGKYGTRINELGNTLLLNSKKQPYKSHH